MTAGPTQNYGDPRLGQWKPHPGLATVVRGLVRALPPGLAIGFGLAATRWASPQRLGVNHWIWLIGEVACTLALLHLGTRASNRLLPLSTLLRLGSFFPDQVPSRFRIALQAHSTRALSERLQGLGPGQFQRSEESYALELLELVARLRDHDRITRGHSERVQIYAGLIAEELKLSEEDCAKVRWAALLHDVGKLHVPAAILNLTGRPNEQEWAVLSSHPAHGTAIAQPLAHWLGPWLDAIGQHHERWDGDGYPNKLTGTQISLGARIVAVADTYDVITSARSYKKPLSASAARAELARCAGRQFDPQVVRAFLAIGIGRLRITAGPLSFLACLPALRSLPLASFASVSSTATSTITVGLTAATFGLAPVVGVIPVAQPDTLVAASGPLSSHTTGRPKHTPRSIPGRTSTDPQQSSPATLAPDALSLSLPATPTSDPIPSDGPGPGLPTGGSAPSIADSPATLPNADPPATSDPATAGPPAPAPPAGPSNAGRPTTVPPGPATPSTGSPPTTSTSAAPPSTSAAPPTAAPPATPTATPATACAQARAGARSLPNADLSGCDLRGVTLTGEYGGVNLAGAKLTGSTLTQLNLAGARLNGVDLTGATIAQTSFNAARLSGAKLDQTQISRSSFYYAAMTGVGLTGAQVSFTAFDYANLQAADLSGLQGGGSFNSFTGADLSKAKLSQADLSGTAFIQTVLAGTDLNKTNLRVATLLGATGVPKNANQATWSSTVCPSGVVKSVPCF